MRVCALQNLFRICGDFAHLFSFFILFFKIYQTKQVGGAAPALRCISASQHGPLRQRQACESEPLACVRPTAGISLKTQILYVIVFCTRYMDLLWNFASMYNWCMKVRSRATPDLMWAGR